MKGLPDQQFTLQWVPAEPNDNCAVMGCENDEAGSIVIKSGSLDMIFVTPYRSCSLHNKEILMLVGQLLTVVDTETVVAVGQMVKAMKDSPNEERPAEYPGQTSIELP